jgi:hypothetical protein
MNVAKKRPKPTFNRGDRVKTPKGLGTVVTGTKYIRVLMEATGQTLPFTLNEVRLVEAAGDKEPWEDAMYHRAPGSFEGGGRR